MKNAKTVHLGDSRIRFIRERGAIFTVFNGATVVG